MVSPAINPLTAATTAASSSNTSTPSRPPAMANQATVIPHLLGSKSKEALSKFRGEYWRVKTFLNYYERLLTTCNITNSQEKCEHILLYVNE